MNNVQTPSISWNENSQDKKTARFFCPLQLQYLHLGVSQVSNISPGKALELPPLGCLTPALQDPRLANERYTMKRLILIIMQSRDNAPLSC